uniref:NADH-ubiquinone oxidoreductase chain 3 n=1 Tax=Ciona robusta TaxID=1774208 RepID=A0A1W1B7S3_9ASCI|nr:NADH dehydrogenase subunit 3 [Ciona robusta]SBU37557.1 NADH dehydrogenase subunit 3 [Ciona robusta]
MAFMFLLVVCLSSLLLFIGTLVMKGFVLNIFNASFSSYECGFMTMMNFKNFYTMQFFIIGLSFMLFDLEILLFLPFIYSESTNSPSIYWALFFLFIVSYLLVYELSMKVMSQW